jgi:hypothetical protein
MLRTNKPENPALFLSVKQREVCSSMFGFTGDQSLTLLVPTRNKTVFFLSSQHHETCMGEETNLKPATLTHSNVTKHGADALDKLMK